MWWPRKTMIPSPTRCKQLSSDTVSQGTQGRCLLLVCFPLNRLAAAAVMAGWLLHVASPHASWSTCSGQGFPVGLCATCKALDTDHCAERSVSALCRHQGVPGLT
jgi:hypothetical protein